MSANVLATLLPSTVDQHELLGLLGRHFSHASMIGTQDVAYPNVDQPALIAKFNRYGELVALITGTAMTAERLGELKARILAELVTSAGSTIRASILFSVQPVQGHYEGPAGTLHILPAPDHAPRPPVTFANHPFLIEFPVQSSSDWPVTSSRHQRRMWEWTWTLAAILSADIQGIGPMTHSSWSFVTDGVGPDRTMRSEWVQEGYGYDGFEPNPGVYTESQQSAITLVSDAEYYSGGPRTLGSPHVLPASFSMLLLALSQLQADRHKRWYRAVRWFYTGERIRAHSYSAWFTSLVAAIEALAEQPVERRPCRCCGLDTAPGATRRFRDFVDAHIGGPVQGSNPGRLYSMRSNFVHGRELAFWDEQPWHFGAMTSITNELYRRAAELTWTVRAVLVNWLARTLFTPPVAIEQDSIA